jgi:CheY-like chemotaxis protein
LPDAALRILIVEDHPALGRFIAAVLEGAGWSVVGPMGDYAAAVEAAQQLSFDLALIDRVLQGDDAFAIAAAVRRRGIPCLLMSGYPRSGLPEQVRDLPFLEKPFSKDALLEAVRAAAGGVA